MFVTFYNGHQASDHLLESLKDWSNIEKTPEPASGVAIHNFCGAAALAASFFAGCVCASCYLLRARARERECVCVRVRWHAQDSTDRQTDRQTDDKTDDETETLGVGLAVDEGRVKISSDDAD